MEAERPDPLAGPGLGSRLDDDARWQAGRVFRASIAMLVLMLGLSLGPATTHAQSVSPRPRSLALVGVDNPRLTLAAAIAVGLAIALGVGDPTLPPTWGANPFDAAVRDGVRLHDVDARTAIGRTSDFLVAGVVVYTALVEGLAIPLSQDGPEAAWQSTAAYALAMGLSATFDELMKIAASRSRPREPGCDASPVPTRCATLTSGGSFYSGHAAMAFTSAGFSCAMHLDRSLYGDAGADGAACGASLLAATTISLFRLMADQHYLTDVLTGAILGFAMGYLIPILVIPAGHPTADRTSATDARLFVLPTTALGGGGVESLGLNALGAF